MSQPSLAKKIEPLKSQLADSVRLQAPSLLHLSHQIHANPELGFEEVLASAWICDQLAKAGLDIEYGVGGLPTAFVAKKGTGATTVAICAEYDALPGIGHACGHNIIAACAVGAGIALSNLVDDLEVTVKVIGTPAEEGGGGKIILLEQGVFDDVDFAMMVHPGPTDQVQLDCLAVSHFMVRYSGKAAHASGFPQEGINAGDALTIAQVAIGLLRQQLPQTSRVHGIVRTGGTAANIIPDLCEAEYFVRTPTLDELSEIEERVQNCFRSGALATGCQLSTEYLGPNYSEFRQDLHFQEIYRKNAQELGRVFPQHRSTPMSTDMANVSLRIPSIHPMISINSLPAVNHQPEFAAASISSYADNAIIDGAIALAWSAADLLLHEQERSQFVPKLEE